MITDKKGKFRPLVDGLSTSENQTNGTQKSQEVDTDGNNIGGKFYDEADGTYKGFLFNAEAPQVCSQDYLLSLSEGDILGHFPFTKFGRVSGVNNVLVDVWRGEGGTASMYVFPSVAQKMNVVSTSANDDDGNTGIEKIMLVGLDANYAEISEEVTLNGTVVVTTVLSFLRVNSCYVTQSGSVGSAVGVITVKNTSGTPNTITYSVIDIGLSACRQIIYTVPAGKTLYLTSINVGSGAGGNSIKLNAVTFTPKYRLFGENFFLPAGEIFSLNDSVLRFLEVPGKFIEKTDIKISAQGDYNAGGTVCISAVRGWIE